MIGRRDGDAVDLAVLEQPADVGVGLDFLVPLPELLDLRIEVGAVHVAERDHAHVGDLAEVADVLFAFAADFHAGADADDAQADGGVGAEHPREGRHRQAAPERRQRSAGQGGTLKESPSREAGRFGPGGHLRLTG
jgi:hypothetical protein